MSRKRILGVDSAIYDNQGSVLDMLSDPHLLHVVLDLLQEVNVLYVRSFLCAQCLTTNHGLSLTYISLCC